MDRASFLIESTGQRISCLLNPEHVVMRRLAGVRPSASGGGKLAGMRLRDDVLVDSGGGRTEIELSLLFDLDVAGSSLETRDVRELTAPLWSLAETTPRVGQAPEPALFIWGKAWNLPVVIEAISERLERFDAGGRPSRAWMRVRMLRVDTSHAAAMDRRRSSPRAAGEERAAIQSASGGSDVEQAMLLAEFMTGSPSDWREYIE